jgi:hypothetical protein
MHVITSVSPKSLWPTRLFFVHKGIVVQFYCFFFFPSGRSSTLFCMPSDDVGYFVFFFFVLLWDRGGREILRQGNSLTEFLIRAPISRLWGNFEAVLCFCGSRTITQVHPLLFLQLVPKYDDVFLLLLFRSLAIIFQHWSPLLTSIACDS